MHPARHQLACTALGQCVNGVLNVQICKAYHVQGSKADAYRSQAMHSPCSNVRVRDRTSIRCERQLTASYDVTLQLHTEYNALAFMIDALSLRTSESPGMHLQTAHHLPVREDTKAVAMTAASSSQCRADHAWSPSPATSVVSSSTLLTASLSAVHFQKQGLPRQYDCMSKALRYVPSMTALQRILCQHALHQTYNHDDACFYMQMEPQAGWSTLLHGIRAWSLSSVGSAKPGTRSRTLQGL